MNQIQILIIDLGSQYTEIIRRSLRYLGFHSVILPPSDALEWINANKPKGIILSGGSASVYDSDAPKIPKEILDFKIPVLGICYGMQWMAYINNKNTVHKIKDGKSYGPVLVSLSKSKLFNSLSKKINAWSSHGDSVKKVPNGFKVIATSKSGGVIEAMENEKERLYAVQFHPEVEQTEDENIILNNFVNKICKCRKDYSKKDIIKEIGEKTKKILGEDKAVIGVSGGVDSTTLAAILAPILGNQLKAFFIDTGGMRKGEIEKVKNITKAAKIKLEVVTSYKDKFIKEVGMTIDSEEKRSKFRQVYGEVFKEIAVSFGAKYIIQGTLATDLIESGHSGSSALIKTHHNVNLDLGLKEIMPLSDFFKFEVRDMARMFGLGSLLVGRQPFPGPGLFLRVVGTRVTSELLDIVREADDEVMKILQKNKLYDKISQTVVALMGTKTVGVKGDGRVYGYSLVVRTVETVDFMTVKGFYLPPKVCEEINSTLIRHPNIVRVLYDWTSKPPATTEFE
jgi:GMP synthase (glutamine-hydrolysing)